MIRVDGNFTIYKIQHWSAGKWVSSSLDHFGTPHILCASKGFSACGDCWQQTGVHGTFDLHAASEGLAWMTQEWPDHWFRIAKVTISQLTEGWMYGPPVKDASVGAA